ncbi:unnamed protein product [Rhodiola kirilowii]
MSMVGELTFFLGIQVRQLENGTEISQQKYLSEVVKKYGLGGSKNVNTPSSPNESLVKDDGSPKTDATIYCGMIGSLLYLTASRPDIMFSVCQCARFQAEPRESHVKAVKRILRYLKGTEKLVWWYPRVKSLKLEGFIDADFAGDRTDRKIHIWDGSVPRILLGVMGIEETEFCGIINSRSRIYCSSSVLRSDLMAS